MGGKVAQRALIMPLGADSGQAGPKAISEGNSKEAIAGWLESPPSGRDSIKGGWEKGRQESKCSVGPVGRPTPAA